MVERIVVGSFDTNCYIFSNGKKECIIIDPGGNDEQIIANINLLKMIPVGIVLTHGHIDHTASVGRLIDAYNGEGIKIQVAIHGADKKYLGKQAEKSTLETLKNLGVPNPEYHRELFPTLPEADIILQEGDSVFNTELVVLETPGHTRGSICLYSEKDGMLFSGDTLFFQGIGRTDLPGASEKQIMKSIQEKLLNLPPETRVFPGHGLATTIERELKGNPFLR